MNDYLPDELPALLWLPEWDCEPGDWDADVNEWYWDTILNGGNNVWNI